MAKRAVMNRWGNSFRVGDSVIVRHNDGIKLKATITGFVTSGAYAKAYGKHARINTGALVAIDDISPDAMKTNPSKKRKPRTPAQRVATARMLAANRARREVKANPTLAKQRQTKFKRSLKAAMIVDKHYRRNGKFGVYTHTATGKNAIAFFATKAHAFEYARAFNKAHAVRVTVET